MSFAKKKDWEAMAEASYPHKKPKKSRIIEIPLDYAKNIHGVLERHTSLCFEIVSQDLKDTVSDEAYKKLQELYYKYHNANCGPFNRALKRLIDDAK